MKNKVKAYSVTIGLLFFLSSCIGTDAQRIKIDGSATVLTMTQAVVEDFAATQAGTEITASASGTGGGFQKFVNDEIDIQDASRPIGMREIATAKTNDVSYYEVAIAKDAIIVAVNKTNTWMKDLSEEQLYNIFKADSEVKRWSDINSAWPETKINFYVPALDSGTFDYFHTHIMQGTTEVRADVTASQDLNILVRGVEGDQDALGFFSYAYYQSAKEKVNGLSINGVTPQEANIISHEYPLTRELYLYINEEKYKNKPIVQQFVAYYLEHAKKLAREVGFISLSDEEYRQEKAKLAL